MNKVTNNYEVDEIHVRALEFIVNSKDAILDTLGIPFTLTGGWVEDGPRRICQHGDEYLKPLIERGALAGDLISGLNMHFWLTSPAHEILDIFLAGMIARAMTIPAADDRARGVIYYANDEPDTDVRFISHPTIVGEEFLEKIGALMPTI